MADVVALAAEVEKLSPADQLRLAAGLLEAKKPEIAYRLIDRVHVELGATLALARLRKAGE